MVQIISLQIKLNHIEESYNNNNIYITLANEGQGYTNGFYFGKPSVLIKSLKRYEYVDNYFPNPNDYEYIFKRSIDDNNIIRRKSDLLFFKIRANKTIFFSQTNRLYIKIFSRSLFNEILKTYNNLCHTLKNN